MNSNANNKENKKDKVCDLCKVTTSIVTTNDLFWCANCFSNYLFRTSNRARINK